MKLIRIEQIEGLAERLAQTFVYRAGDTVTLTNKTFSMPVTYVGSGSIITNVRGVGGKLEVTRGNFIPTRYTSAGSNHWVDTNPYYDRLEVWSVKYIKEMVDYLFPAGTLSQITSTNVNRRWSPKVLNDYMYNPNYDLEDLNNGTSTIPGFWNSFTLNRYRDNNFTEQITPFTFDPSIINVTTSSGGRTYHTISMNLTFVNNGNYITKIEKVNNGLRITKSTTNAVSSREYVFPRPADLGKGGNLANFRLVHCDLGLKYRYQTIVQTQITMISTNSDYTLSDQAITYIIVSESSISSRNITITLPPTIGLERIIRIKNVSSKTVTVVSSRSFKRMTTMNISETSITIASGKSVEFIGNKSITTIGDWMVKI